MMTFVPAHEGSQSNSTLQLFDGAIVRCSRWPIEALEPFGSAKLVSLAREAQELESSIQFRQKKLSAELYAHLLTIENRSARRYLLEARRTIRSTTKPLVFWQTWRQHLSRLPGGLLEALDEDHRQRARLAALKDDLALTYSEELDRERRALKAVAGTIEFQRALTFANPDLAIRWERYLELDLNKSGDKGSHRLKKSRETQMETAVLFYLLRAAARPTPGGLWAGVAPLVVREDDDFSRTGHGWSVMPATRRFLFTVNLESFARVVDHLSLTRYRSSPTVRLSPSAYLEGDLWWFQPINVDKHEWRSFSSEHWSSVILEAFLDRQARPLAAVVDHCALLFAQSVTDSARHSLSEAAGQLLNCGLLVSGLRFPESTLDCWDALAAIAAQLTDSDRVFWNSKVVHIRSLCNQLSHEIGQCSPEDIRHTYATVKSELENIFAWAGLDEPLSSPTLLADFRAGFEVTCTPASWRAIQIAVTEVLSFYQTHGAPDSLRRLTLNALFSNGSTNESYLADIVRKKGNILESSRQSDRPEMEGVLEDIRAEVVGLQNHWYQALVAGSLGQAAVTAPGAMFASKPLAGFDGTIVLTISSSGRVRAEWGRPHSFSLMSRFTDLLTAPTPWTSLAESIRHWYTSWEQYGFLAAEIVGADPVNPNAAIRPVLTRSRLAPGGSDFALSDFFIESAPGEFRPWIRSDSSGLRLIPVYNCTARIGVRDAASDILYRLALAHGWEFFCRRLFPANQSSERIPRLLAPRGTVLSPTRWFLREADVEELLRLDELHRFISWLGHARRLGLPNCVRVATSSGPESPLLYLPITSPLAMRALFSKVVKRPTELEFVEDHTEPDEWLLKDEHGLHYSSEVVVGWRDPSYFCSVIEEPPKGKGVEQ